LRGTWGEGKKRDVRLCRVCRRRLRREGGRKKELAGAKIYLSLSIRGVEGTGEKESERERGGKKGREHRSRIPYLSSAILLSPKKKTKKKKEEKRRGKKKKGHPPSGVQPRSRVLKREGKKKRGERKGKGKKTANGHGYALSLSPPRQKEIAKRGRGRERGGSRLEALLISISRRKREWGP